MSASFPSESPAERLLVILDGPTLRAQRRSPLDIALSLRDCGRIGLWYRDHGLALAGFDEQSNELREALGSDGPQLILGGSHRTALRLGAGVHLGAGQTNPARRPRPLGRSCHSLGEVAAAAGAGHDYVTLSPIWPTTSVKAEPRSPLGLETLRRASQQHPIPIFALGGVTPERVGACLEAGAHGVAVLGAICAAPEPVDVVHALLDAIARNI